MIWKPNKYFVNKVSILQKQLFKCTWYELVHIDHTSQFQFNHLVTVCYVFANGKSLYSTEVCALCWRARRKENRPKENKYGEISNTSRDRARICKTSCRFTIFSIRIRIAIAPFTHTKTLKVVDPLIHDCAHTCNEYQLHKPLAKRSNRQQNMSIPNRLTESSLIWLCTW